METSLLRTKLNIPPTRPQTVLRPRLTERLQEGLNYNLILVSAPAGFGKTTLISEWARQIQPQTFAAWVSLDEGDNDPVRFWDYFIAALQKVQPSCGESILPILHSSQQLPAESLLTALINELSSTSSEFLLVLDDYHLIESKEIHDGITYLLEHIPAQMHLLIASRADPPLPLARYRTKRIMLDIGADAMRFNQEEVAELLEGLKISGLSLEDISALNTRTEGWIAGLIMAALSLSGQKDIPGFIAAFTGSQRYVMDYLMEEVLQKQTEEMRDFLLKTSVLERLSGPLCDAITGGKVSKDILLNLERGHLFIVPLDESRQWYRYEHLFADLLRHQLESNYESKSIDELHRRACQWYVDNNLPVDAIHHALAARDWERAVELISEHGIEIWRRGENVTFLNWTQQLPEAVLISHPELCLGHIGSMAMAGSLEATELMLDKLEKTVHDEDILMGKITAWKALIAGRRFDYPLTVELAKKALSLLPPDDLYYRGSSSQFVGQIYVSQGKYQEAEPYLTKAYEAFQQTGDYFSASGALSGLMWIMQDKGELQRVAEMCRQALEAAMSLPATAVPHIFLSTIFYEWNDLEAATNHIGRAIEQGQLIGTMQARVLFHDLLARYKLAQGDETGFLRMLEKSDLLTRDIADRTAVQAEHAAYHILFALRQDDLVTVEKWGGKLTESVDALPFHLNYIPSRLLIAQGKKPEAMEKLQVTYDKAVESGAKDIMIKCRVCQALAAENEESAAEFLSDALTMAEPEGYIRTFVDEGRLLKPLLEKALSRRIMPGYTGKLVTIIEAEERQRRKRKKVEGFTPLYHALLSERELEVLRLMAEGLSNQQIADRLIISLSTAKNHVHNILEKLNVRGRTQAVTQARELGLI